MNESAVDYQKFCELLGEIVLLAENDQSCHLVMVEMLMATVGKICNYTLKGTGYETNSKTKEKFTDLMVELCSAMLRDYLELHSNE